MKVGTSLFKRGSRSISSQSRIRVMPSFLTGASMLELTLRDCQSSSKKVISFTVKVRSVIYLLIAHFENKDRAKRACPEWLQERFFLRDEHVHLMQPIGSSEGIQIWEKEEIIEQGGRVSIPGLSGYGGPMVVAIARASSRHRRCRDEEKEEEEHDELIELEDLNDDDFVYIGNTSSKEDEDLLSITSGDSGSTPKSPGKALMRMALES